MDTASGEGSLIWIIDKDPDYCELLGQLLKGWGFQVECFTHKSQVVERLETPSLPALILLDVVIGEDEQSKVMEYLRNQKALRKTPLVVITGGAPLELMKGATERYLKPVTPDALKRIVDRYCIGELRLNDFQQHVG